MDAWIGVVGVVIGAFIGALAVLGGQYMSGQTAQRIAHHARQRDVLDDVALKVASVRAQAVAFQYNSALGSQDLAAALLALGAVTPLIHDSELQQRVDSFVEKTSAFRTNPVDWKTVNEPYTLVRERLTDVYKQLG